MSNTIAFGDFQTPPALADAVCARLAAGGLQPASVVEPTCGQGHFLAAALRRFSTVKSVYGLDLNVEHLAQAAQRLKGALPEGRVELQRGDFFTHDWDRALAALPRPVLVLGNPPWVTHAGLGRLNHDNRPPRARVGQRGIDAITGSSNFDICEWMIRRMLDWRAIDAVAMLCKTQVARRVLADATTATGAARAATLCLIDAARHFGVAVDACLFTLDATAASSDPRWPVFATLKATTPMRLLGWRGGQVVADPDAHDQLAHLHGYGRQRWRSGVKHDCARILELTCTEDGHLRNGLGQPVDVEPDCLFPLLKGSDLDRGATPGHKLLLLPQRHTGDDPEDLRARAPKTHRYLETHAQHFAARRSRIYRGRSRFAVFGVGPYTFAPWKVAVAGLYKRFAFRVIGPHQGRPVVLDDTAYLLPCQSEGEAHDLAARLGHPDAQRFLQSLVFWDSKRPVTARLLGSLNLDHLTIGETPAPYAPG